MILLLTGEVRCDKSKRLIYILTMHQDFNVREERRHERLWVELQRTLILFPKHTSLLLVCNYFPSSKSDYPFVVIVVLVLNIIFSKTHHRQGIWLFDLGIIYGLYYI